MWGEEQLAHVNPIWVCRLVLYPSLGSYPPTAAGASGSISRCWLKQTVHSFGSPEFSPVGALSGVIFGIRPGAVGS